MIIDESTEKISIDESQIINREFFNSMKESLLCTICTSLITIPKMCSQCETPYCNECISQWYSSKKKCPMRCSSSSIVDINRSLKKIHDAVKIRCPEGCEVSLLEFTDHAMRCEKRKRECWNCKSKCLLGDMKIRSEREILNLKTEIEELKAMLNEKNNMLSARLNQPSNIQSSLIDSNLYNKLNTWIGGNSSVSFSLIYKGTRNGFESKDFHRLCDNKGMTLVVMKTIFNKIIGGFTVLNWTSPPTNGIFYRDSSKRTFLFSGNLGERYKLKDEGKFAICCNRNYGPIFGHYDLLVVSKNNVNNTGNFDIGDCYDYNRTKDEFYGGTPYRLLEIEVFKVEIA